MKKWITIIACAILLVTYIFNYSIVSLFAGYPSSTNSVIYEDTDLNGAKFRIVAATDGDENYTKLGILKKSKVGIWYLEQEDDYSEQLRGYYLVTITLLAFTQMEGLSIPMRTVTVVAGNNAIKDIAISNLLSEGDSASVQQQNNHYVIVFEHDNDQNVKSFEYLSLIDTFTK